MLRAGLIYGSGDLLASLISGGFSPARAIGMTLIGGLLYALEIHTWFGWLAKRYPEPASPVNAGNARRWPGAGSTRCGLPATRCSSACWAGERMRSTSAC